MLCLVASFPEVFYVNVSMLASVIYALLALVPRLGDRVISARPSLAIWTFLESERWSSLIDWRQGAWLKDSPHYTRVANIASFPGHKIKFGSGLGMRLALTQ